MSFDNTLLETIQRYLKKFPGEKNRLGQLIAMHNAPGVDLSLRATIPQGHVTASAIIVSKKLDKVLMVLHKKLDIWVVPGGHYDKTDNDLSNTALREASEEVGLKDLVLHPWHIAEGIPLDIDTHAIPENSKKNEGAHFHYDFRYVLHMPAHVDVKVDPVEVLDFKWIKLDKINRYSTIAPAISKLPLLEK